MKGLLSPLKRLSLTRRLTCLVMIALSVACIILAAALSVAGDQMVYTIYTAQITANRGDADYSLPSISKEGDRPGTILLPGGAQADAAARGARLQYRVETIVYVVCTIAAAGVATYMIAESCLHPLLVLKQQMSGLSAQNLSAPTAGAPHTLDEIESLSNAFQDMSRRLDQAFEAQRRFSADAAHELRTPLAVIRTRLDVFSKTREHTPEEYQALLESVGRQTERLSLLVQDLLDLSCLDSAGSLEYVCLAPLLEEVALDAAPLADGRGMTLLVEGDGAVLGNPLLLARAISNLVENAVKYGREGGSIRLSARSEGDGVSVWVEDDGPGIPPEHRARIFDPFYRVDKSRSRSLGGAGLGLALVRSIVERHGGTVCIADGPGCRFRLCFPAPRGQ